MDEYTDPVAAVMEQLAESAGMSVGQVKAMDAAGKDALLLSLIPEAPPAALDTLTDAGMLTGGAPTVQGRALFAMTVWTLYRQDARRADDARRLI